MGVFGLLSEFSLDGEVLKHHLPTQRLAMIARGLQIDVRVPIDG